MKKITEIKQAEEAEISSSAEHFHIETINFLVNQMNLNMIVQVVRERRTQTRRRMI